MFNPRVHVICGPMFAGKTSEGLRQGATIADIHGGRCLYVTHCMDNRPDITSTLGVSSHSSLNMRFPEDLFICVKTNDITKTYKEKFSEFKKQNIVSFVIDEAQFFDSCDIEDIIRLVNYKRSVSHLYICGLDGDGKQQPFTDWISRAIPYSECVRKLTAFCMHRSPDGTLCNLDANFTKRRSNAPTGNVGGTERWVSVCGKHL